MKRMLITLLLWTALPSFGPAAALAQQYGFPDTRLRVWTDSSGQGDVTARLTRYNAITREIELFFDEQTVLRVPFDDISMADRRYLTRQVEKIKRLTKQGVRVSVKTLEEVADNSRLDGDRFVLNITAPRAVLRKQNPDINRLYEIDWYSSAEKAAEKAVGKAAGKSTKVANKNTGVGRARPIIWFRALGDLSGNMCVAGHRMRAVTFSTAEVQNVIAHHFVALNTGIGDETSVGSDISCTRVAQPELCARGNRRQNIQTLFMTPDLEIIHVTTGFVSPAELLVEMQFAVELFQKLNFETDNRFDLVRSAHADPRMRARLSKQLQHVLKINSAIGPRDSRGENRDDDPKKIVLKEDQYMVQRPLIPMNMFEENPAELLGR